MGKGARNRQRREGQDGRLRREQFDDGTQVFGAHMGDGAWAGVSATAVSLVMKGDTIEEVNALGKRATEAIEAALKDIDNVAVVTEPEAQHYVLEATLKALEDHAAAGSFGGGGPWKA